MVLNQRYRGTGEDSDSQLDRPSYLEAVRNHFNDHQLYIVHSVFGHCEGDRERGVSDFL
jgi:hypothetical protein